MKVLISVVQQLLEGFGVSRQSADRALGLCNRHTSECAAASPQQSDTRAVKKDAAVHFHRRLAVVFNVFTVIK